MTLRWWLLGFVSALVVGGGCDSDTSPEIDTVTAADLQPVVDHALSDFAPDLGIDADQTTDAVADLVQDSAKATAITAPAKTWTWIPFPDARCADNSVTGIGVNLNLASSTELLIFIKGGGACWDVQTCVTKPQSKNLDGFDASDFNSLNLDSTGILNRKLAGNPFKDWNYVYIPYCTGDLHSGVQYSAVSQQHHVGHLNIAAYLKRLAPTFPNATQVLLTGSSAGGFGSLFNYHQVQQTFQPAPVDLLDDSGPLLAKAYLKPKLQQAWRTAWGLNKAMPAGCTACQTGDLDELPRHLASAHPTRRFGLISSQHDLVIRGYLGQGYTPSQVMPAADLEAGLDQLADTMMAPHPNFRVYYTATSWHVYLNTTMLATTSVSGVKLIDWIDTLASGQGTWSNVRP